MNDFLARNLDLLILALLLSPFWIGWYIKREILETFGNVTKRRRGSAFGASSLPRLGKSSSRGTPPLQERQSTPFDPPSSQ